MMDFLSLLELLLRTEITIKNVRHASFPNPIDRVADVVVDSSRIIFLESGCMKYVVEGTSHQIDAPAILFIPAWVRRWWTLPEGKRCIISWCEFSAVVFEPSLRALLWRSEADWEVEAASFRRMILLWKGEAYSKQELGVALQIEGELKATLARFFAADQILPRLDRQTGDNKGTVIPDVEKALRWLEGNFMRENAGALLKSKATHAYAGFRRLFKEQTGCTPTNYILTLRMRYARFLLFGKKMSVKEVAAAVGFNDALWFSKQYHAFWGYPPKQERSSPKGIS